MTLKVYTDGGSIGNPGPAAIGIVFFVEDKRVFTHGEGIGKATNNVAEYTALIRAMSELKTQISKLGNISKIKFYSDSRLLVNQVNGLFKVKNSKIREFIFKIRILEQEILADRPAGRQVSYHLIPREENREADRLVKSELT